MSEQFGVGKKVVTASEIGNKVVARKSIIAKRNIARGEMLTDENLTCKRPGNGISPMHWYEVLGKKAEKDFVADSLIEVEGISWEGEK